MASLFDAYNINKSQITKKADFTNISDAFKKGFYGKKHLKNLGLIEFSDTKPDNIITVEIEYDNRIIPGTFVHLMGFGDYSGIAYISKVNVKINVEQGISLRLTMMTDKMLQTNGLDINVIKPDLFLNYSEQTIDPQFKPEETSYANRRNCCCKKNRLSEKIFNKKELYASNKNISSEKDQKNLYDQREFVGNKRPSIGGESSISPVNKYAKKVYKETSSDVKSHPKNL